MCVCVCNGKKLHSSPFLPVNRVVVGWSCRLPPIPGAAGAAAGAGVGPHAGGGGRRLLQQRGGSCPHRLLLLR